MRKSILFISVITLFLFIGMSIASAAEQVYFYYNDPAGTPLAISDMNATVVWRAHYLPFGEEVIDLSTMQNNKMFVGKEKDSESGLYHFDVRNMDPEAGRFVSADSVGPVDPRTGKINRQILGNPQMLNRYAYAINNPYHFIDPDGRLTVNIWDFQGKNIAWGHASITLENGTHISWWPSAEGRKGMPGFPQIYSAPANEFQTFATDISPGFEGRMPDHQIKIIGLDEEKIEKWWNDFKTTHDWKTLTQNCSTIAADALKEGGGDEYYSSLQGDGTPVGAQHLIWTPSDVKGYAENIKENMPQ